MGECCTFRQSPRTQRRINGCQLPLNCQQVVAWIVFISTALVNFIILIEIQFHELKVVSIIAYVILYVCHVSSHVTAALVDPSERELRKLKVNNVPEFDRSIHAHVIENGRCHLCNIYTSSRHTKHCSLCNKCVDQFDHHCKWLNNCVGRRNYASFITCVTTALLIATLTATLCLTDIILFLERPKKLSPVAQQFINCTKTDTSYIEKYCKNSISFLTFLIIFGVSALAIACALLHLCCFHVYISLLGVSTYEYIVKGSQSKKSRSSSNRRNKCCMLNTISRSQNDVRNNDTISKTYQIDAADEISTGKKVSDRESANVRNSLENGDRHVATLITSIISNELDKAKRIVMYDKNKIHPQDFDEKS